MEDAKGGVFALKLVRNPMRVRTAIPACPPLKRFRRGRHDRGRCCAQGGRRFAL